MMRLARPVAYLGKWVMQNKNVFMKLTG